MLKSKNQRIFLILLGALMLVIGISMQGKVHLREYIGLFVAIVGTSIATEAVVRYKQAK